MVSVGEDIRYINKTNSGFPAHLDWETLRSIGIKHIGELSGKLWTDYNIHDPGVTILEILCYALTDLGYRTCLPTADILARNQENWSQSDDFFSASDILTCNPLTITDFRKMLIDLPGVRNAWLEDAYYRCVDQRNMSGDKKETECSACYNGLYHVLLETDGANTDVSHPDVRELIQKVRSRLIGQRNICEDFVDIRLLCKKQIGLCIDIELDKDADADQVYQSLVVELKKFFSPAPRFYTLKQMLVDKKRTIDEIFAGRPYNLKESHGFIDTRELNEIRLRKEIHLSDVYKVILAVPGVRNVNRVGWKEDGTKCVQRDNWVFNIPENHVVEFNHTQSLITFTRHGVQVPVDFSVWNEMLELTNGDSAKVIYKIPSPYLDSDFPKGVFREDLAEYASLQTDFPRVYGLDHGGLPADAPARRTAQALQLKGYLLFFDQLLAGYLAQLANVKSLFSLRTVASQNEKHSYHNGSLDHVPDIDKLLRLQDKGFIEPGTILARPVKRAALENSISQAKITKSRCLPISKPYFYRDPCSVDLAMQMWNQELVFTDHSPTIFQDASGCWRFYLASQDPDTVLLGETTSATEDAARAAAEAARYAGKYTANFRIIHESDSSYSFVLELELLFCLQHLQQMLESPSQYLDRRNQFLDHLLSRFAERFADFALLSFGITKGNELAEQQIHAKENFLHQYPDLSSNRGKAFDYHRAGWNNANLSGFEKRTMALLGIGDLTRKDLCNFVVEKYDEHYFIIVRSSTGEELLSVPEKFYSIEAAEEALKSLVASLGDAQNYLVTGSDSPYSVRIFFNDSRYASSVISYSNQAEAILLRNGLIRLFNPTVSERDVVENKIVVRPRLLTSARQSVGTCLRTFEDENEFWDFAKETPNFFGKNAYWQLEPLAEESDLVPDFEARHIINWTGFRSNGIYIKDQPDKVSFQLLDIRNSFLLQSSIPFDTEAQATEAAQAVLLLIARTPDSMTIHPDRGEYRIQIRYMDTIMAETEEFNDEGAAASARETILRIVESQKYSIDFVPEATTWRYQFITGYASRQFVFKSADEFNSIASALNTARNFYTRVKASGLSLAGKTVSIAVNQKLRVVFDASDEAAASEIYKDTSNYLHLRSELATIFAKPAQLSKHFIINDIGDARLKWVYRLVDKGNLLAFYTSKQKTTDAAENTRKRLFQAPPLYRITEIVLSEDALLETRESNGKEHFFYRIIRRVDSGYEVLFQSVVRYQTKSAAWQAFNENLLAVLANAMDAGQYGPGKPISLTELVYDPDKLPYDNAAIVFVPMATKSRINEWYDDVVISELVRIARQYPIRYTSKQQDEFYQLFPCEDDERTKTIAICGEQPEGQKWFYFVLSDDAGQPVWQSNRYYVSRQEAVEQFRFFRMLLRYPGNFVVHKDYCGCKHNNGPCECYSKVYIREVLAESTSRFATESESWSSLENFIDVAQSPAAFHAFQRADDCTYTFDVFCQPCLIHPREYYSDKQRNENMQRLHEAFLEFSNRKFPRLIKNEAGWLILDSTDAVVAEILAGENKTSFCLADIFYLFFKNIHKYKKGLGVVVSEAGATQAITIRPPDLEIDVGQWATQLQRLAELYYIVRKEDGKYYLEVRLEGYGLSGSSANSNDCDSHSPAWVSQCGFEGCEEAEEQLRVNQSCLEDLSNYRGTYDCECGPFRIEVICHEKKVPDSGERKRRKEITELSSKRVKGRIAYNPQSYHTPAINCEAIARSKQLINSEGLHLVEHILLRPICPEDCEGDLNKLSTCVKREHGFSSQKLLWKSGVEVAPEDDPAAGEHYFTPGEDPYSFVATVFLPAWPARFRTLEHKDMVENLLYREIPAHVLLRVFWLRPVDFCAFENVFKDWTMWLAQEGKPGCVKENPIGALVNCLIKKNYDRLPENPGCDTKNVTRPKGCFESEIDPCEDADVLIKINELFCWNTHQTKDKRLMASVRGSGIDPIEITEPKESRAAFFARRRKQYIDQLGSKPKAFINEVTQFMEQDKFEPRAFMSIVKKIVEKSPAKNDEKLSVPDQKRMLEAVILFFLDKLYSENATPVIKKQIHTFFAGIESSRFNRLRLFDAWKRDNIESYATKTTTEEIWSILNGK